MNDALALKSLGDYLPDALFVLDGIGFFTTESPETLKLYNLTCDKLKEAIQTTEGSLGHRAWKDVTVDGKSWHDHMTTIQSCIDTLQAEFSKKKVALLAKATLAAVELQRRIKSSEGSSPHFVILDGTLFLLLHSLDRLQSLPNQSSDDSEGPLLQCRMECRSAIPDAQHTAAWIDSFPKLSADLQKFANKFMCIYFMHCR